MNKRGHGQPDQTPLASEEPNRRLESWKEIACYLGRTEKTVRRWEGAEVLPVHRLHHEKRSSVYAYSAELEAWRVARTPASNPKPDSNASGIEVGTEEGYPRRLRPWLAGSIIAVVCVAGFRAGMRWSGLRYLVVRGASPVRIQSLAVLPLANPSSEAGQEYLADGMAEQIAAQISKVSPVRVIASSSAMHYRNSKKSPREIARELNVDGVVAGALVRSGSRIRVTVQLVTPSAENRFRADVYEADARNVQDLPRDVARDLGSKIQTGPGTRTAVSFGSEKYLHPETYEKLLTRQALSGNAQCGRHEEGCGTFRASCPERAAVRRRVCRAGRCVRPAGYV